MKTFNHEQFIKLVTSNNAKFKLPEQINGFYFLLEIETDEMNTGIGTDKTIYLQRWELHDDVTINNSAYFLFKMWGQIPDHMLVHKDISEHEGKEIAVPVRTILSILNNLSQQASQLFNEDNLLKTQTIKKSLNRPDKEEISFVKNTDSKQVNRGKSIELCNLGIEAKRNGDFEESLRYYSKAILYDYLNPATYMNSAKVLIGIERYKEALRNILTYIHLKLPFDESLLYQVSSFYQLDKSHKIHHKQEHIDELFRRQPLIRQISIDVNATFNAGLSYLVINKAGLMIPNGISNELIDNERYVILGKLPKGLNLRQSIYANMVHIVGVLFLYMGTSKNLFFWRHCLTQI